MIDGTEYLTLRSPIAIDVCCGGEYGNETYIFADRKYLIDFHVLGAFGKQFDLQHWIEYAVRKTAKFQCIGLTKSLVLL